MARPEEKAQAMLNKWVKMREQEENYGKISAPNRRPHLASHCDHLNDAERWRRQIIREISSGISKIQNTGLGEHAIRDLNDSINKLMREKWHWNKRIVDLGGPDYNKIEKNNQIDEGGDTALGLKGSSGYRYFGVAKDLPGVKELFARNAVKLTKKQRGDIYKFITPDYYGLRDEEDGVLIELEAEAANLRRKKLDMLRTHAQHSDLAKGYDSDEYQQYDLGNTAVPGDFTSTQASIPTPETISKIMLERKKEILLESLF